jgi:hypothetical protein
MSKYSGLHTWHTYTGDQVPAIYTRKKACKESHLSPTLIIIHWVPSISKLPSLLAAWSCLHRHTSDNPRHREPKLISQLLDQLASPQCCDRSPEWMWNPHEWCMWWRWCVKYRYVYLIYTLYISWKSSLEKLLEKLLGSTLLQSLWVDTAMYDYYEMSHLKKTTSLAGQHNI